MSTKPVPDTFWEVEIPGGMHILKWDCGSRCGSNCPHVIGYVVRAFHEAWFAWFKNSDCKWDKIRYRYNTWQGARKVVDNLSYRS